MWLMRKRVWDDSPGMLRQIRTECVMNFCDENLVCGDYQAVRNKPVVSFDYLNSLCFKRLDIFFR